MSNCRKLKSDCSRSLRCEALEKREMLSANAGSMPQLQLPSEPEFVPAVIAPAVDNSLGARDQDLAISAVHLLIDGREVTLSSLDQLLEMEVGSSLQIVGIDYRLNGEEVVSGKIAFEGYLNKLKGSRVRTDYDDGRFGGHDQQGELPFGSASHPGLNDAWKMEAGTESITLVMVRYGADGVAVEDRITIRTQVGTPDFVFNPEVRIKGSSKGVFTGRSVKIHGVWGNAGEGTYRNYAEVDIYHESDPTKIVWSGTLADVVDAGEYDKGQFINKVKQDGFSKSWIPELGGTYTLKFYVDPENRWNESSEDNNLVVAQVEVQDLRYRSPKHDSSSGFGFNHHSVPDVASHAAALASAASLLNASQSSSSEAAGHSTEESSDQVQEDVKDLVVEVAFADNGAVEVRVQDAVKAESNRAEESPSDEWLEAIDTALSMPKS